ncbi:hypothetical protein, partial [uncultured Allobaculum sp.]|uniref:hypothetical protein n=1 Tax=uncultured Allobaculum sp. TaxID=1187017 RepID=UPI00258AF5DA
YPKEAVEKIPVFYLTLTFFRAKKGVSALSETDTAFWFYTDLLRFLLLSSRRPFFICLAVRTALFSSNEIHSARLRVRSAGSNAYLYPWSDRS